MMSSTNSSSKYDDKEQKQEKHNHNHDEIISGRVIVVPNMFIHRHSLLKGDMYNMEVGDYYQPGFGYIDYPIIPKNINPNKDVTYVSSSYVSWMMSMQKCNHLSSSSSSTSSSSSRILPHYSSPAKRSPFSWNQQSITTNTNPNTIMATSSSFPASVDTSPLTSSPPLVTSPILGQNEFVSVIVLGASGDLAKKKTYPALYSLFINNFLPDNSPILGYARSNIALPDFHSRIQSGLKDTINERKQQFLQRCHYHHGSYDQDKDYQSLNQVISELESRYSHSHQSFNRVFYMALPPSVFIPVANLLNTYCKAPNNGWTRIIVEKPFGKDLESSRELGRALAAKWHEHELYRIDHYLGKEMVKNLISLRFANMFFSAVWDRHAISNVQITFKEMIGTEGRGGYFDEFGIVRDVMQNHLLQILTLVAMDRPVTLQADDVRNEKVKVLRCMKPINLSDMVLGQYGPSEDGTKPGYLDDKTVPKGSKSPTYAAAVMYIDNDRWAGIPFILRCGKALNEAKTEVRIQFRDIPGGHMFPSPLSRNELVIRVQPKEAVYLKLMNKEPGLSFRQHIAELDMTYHERYEGIRIPDAYESLLLDVLRGDQANFVRDDELDAAWALFTPVLHDIDAGKVDPIIYPYGSRGPNGLIKFMAQYGVERDRSDYTWVPRTTKM